MLLQVCIHTRAECFLAQIGLQHAQHCGRLAVSDSVEQLLNLRGRFSRLVDRARIRQRVDIQSPAGAADIIQIQNSIPASTACTGLFAIQVAKPSLSQTSSHHFIVTRSPNQWCAISCAITLKRWFS